MELKENLENYPLAPFPSEQLKSQKIKIKSKKLNPKYKKIMDIEHQSNTMPKLFCPTRFRPSKALGVNSNIFEFVRFQKNFPSRGVNEILVYETEYKYG